jgi:hypothetical protein
MINIQIEGGAVSFVSSVMGLINTNLLGAEFVDETRFHLATENGVHLISVLQFTVNNITFESSQQAVDYISTLTIQ